MNVTHDLVPLGNGGLALADEHDDVRGMAVKDVRDHRVGEVEEILVDPDERRARLLVVVSGGVLGLGESHRLVPVDAVSHVRDHVRLERSDLHVDSGFDYDPAIRGPVDYRPVYSYFGYTPFWKRATGRPTSCSAVDDCSPVGADESWGRALRDRGPEGSPPTSVAEKMRRMRCTCASG